MPRKSHYHLLRKKWSTRHAAAKEQLLTKHKEAFDWLLSSLPAKEKLTSSALGALMLVNTLPAFTAVKVPAVPIDKTEDEHAQQVSHQVQTQKFALGLKALLPDSMRELTGEEETKIGDYLSSEFGFKVGATLEDRRLNRSYGYIGAEQHLMRYPGDTMAGHLEDNVGSNRFFFSSGMAPGRGAWGYFVKSKSDLTNADVDREKWYIAVQTFLAPGFQENVRDRYNWFKYRKMLLVNPQTGQAVVADIADAGPAAWTGKHLGGSPEVMVQLGLHKGPRKGAVLYYFIDDPEDRIPLGPV